MNKTKYFKQEIRTDLFAATFAISHKDWTFIPSTEFRNNKGSVVNLMRKHRFDIIPVKDAKGKFSLYISTKLNGDFSLENIEQRKIDQEKDSIYYLTHIRDAIQLLVENDRNFYFLSDYSSIIGLITLVDLNNKYFYHWLYHKLVDLEHLLGKKLRLEKCDSIILKRIKELSSLKNKEGKWFKETLDRYNEDKNKNIDAQIMEYLTFKQIIEIYSLMKLYKTIGYKNLEGFQHNNKALGEIRNTVAHPSRNLISDSKSLKVLWKGILKMEDLSERLLANIHNSPADNLKDQVAI